MNNELEKFGLAPFLLQSVANLSRQTPDFFFFFFFLTPLTRCPFRLPCSRAGQHHKESGNLDYKLQLEIWKGNLGGALEMAANSKQLTEWLVSLSPLGNILVHCRHFHSNVNCSFTPKTLRL